MKKLFVVVAFIAVWYVWLKPNSFAGAETTDYAHPTHEVVLLATSWCGYCKQTRQYFADNNIAYYEYDIETSREGNNLYNDLNGRGIPLVVIGNRVIRGFNPAAMRQALDTL